MKRLLSFVIMALTAIAINAQTDQTGSSATTKDTKNVIYKTVSKKLRIRDKIYIKNMSPYYIMQMVIAIPKDNGELEPLGSATYIAPSEVLEMASFKKHSLKRIKGKTVAIKAKGAKIIMGEQNKTNVWTPYGSVGVRHKDLSPELVNSLKPEDITYNFDVKFFEDRHDLYIELYNTGENGAGVLDF